MTIYSKSDNLFLFQPDDVKTIGDALKNLTVSECVDDFYSPKNGLVCLTIVFYILNLIFVTIFTFFLYAAGESYKTFVH